MRPKPRGQECASLRSFSVKHTVPEEMGQAVRGERPIVSNCKLLTFVLVRTDAGVERKIKATEFGALKRMNKKMCS